MHDHLALFPKHLPLRLAFLVACCSLAGCGLETYEKRLEATRSYYAYLDKLDQNLVAKTWAKPPVDALRVPLKFEEIPPPQQTEGADGPSETPAEDPRQPDYANFKIDGLIGAWKTEVDAQVNNERANQTVYLYAATNHEIFLTGETEKAINFTKDLVTSLEAALQTTHKTDPLVTFPKGHQFTPKQTFDVYVLNSPLMIRGSRYVFEVYSVKQAENQVAMILATPEGMDPLSKVSERIQLMLESMRVSSNPPQPKAVGDLPGAAPAGTAPKGGNF